MSTFHPQFDSLESVITAVQLKINHIDFNYDAHAMLVHLNTGKLIECSINLTPVLQQATKEQLLNYTIIANGTGIHWPMLDEDVSLKSLLRIAIEKQIM